MIKVKLVSLYDYISVPLKDSKPLGILSLNTILSDYEDIDCEIVDFNYMYGNYQISLDEDIEENINIVTNYLLSTAPNVIGFSVMYNTFHLALLIADKIKKLNNSIKIVLGGAHVKFLANEIMSEFVNIDAVFVGESEKVIYPSIISLFNEDKNVCNGVLIRKQNLVYGNVKEEFINNLDELPIIKFDYIDKKYLNSIPLDVGRGCPFKCIFCSTSNFWGNRFRIKSAERIFEEIKYYVNRYQTTDFGFEHDLFVFNKPIVNKVCDYIINSKLNITWRCSSRIDTIDDELLNKMAMSGCKKIYFGIETGSNRMQKIIGKNLNVNNENINNLIDKLIKYNIDATFSFIYGFPQENENDILITLQLIERIFFRLYDSKKLKNVTFQLHKLLYYPGTSLLDDYYEELELRDNGNFDGFVNTDKQIHLINNMITNKKLFIHFYENKNEIRKKYSNLDWIVSNIYREFVPFAPFTYKYIVFFYNNNILALCGYIECIIQNTYKGDLFTYKNKSKIDLIEIMFRIFDELINKYINNCIIKNIFDFEKTVFEFTYKYKNDITEIRNYKYDIFKVIKKITFDIQEEDSYLLFQRNGNNAKVIKIKYSEEYKDEKRLIKV